MPRGLIMLAMTALLAGQAGHARAAAGDPINDPRIDPAPCVGAIAANDDEAIIARCGLLIDHDKTPRPDRLKALVARAAAFARKDQIDRAIADNSAALLLDPTLADVFSARGELWRKKGDRPRAVADFAAAIRLNPQHVAARANTRELAQELERLGAEMAIKSKARPPSK